MSVLFWKKWQNCHLVQFSVNDDKTVNVHWEGPLLLIDSTRYENAMFMGVKTSKFGIKIHKDAKYWGIFDLTNPDKPQLVTYNSIPIRSNSNNIYQCRENYIALRNTGHYLKFYISQYSSVKQLTKKAKPE